MSAIAPTLAEAIMDRIQKIPVYNALGVEILAFSEGGCRARVPKDDRYDGIFQSFHGGMLMAAADTITCFALLTLTGADAAMATTDMNIRFLAPCLTDVIVEARVIKRGKILCPIHADLYDTEGRQVAVAQVTYILLTENPNR